MKRIINRYRAFFKRYGIIDGLLIICFSLEARRLEGRVAWMKVLWEEKED